MLDWDIFFSLSRKQFSEYIRYKKHTRQACTKRGLFFLSTITQNSGVGGGVVTRWFTYQGEKVTQARLMHSAGNRRPQLGSNYSGSTYHQS